jgi:hypothetical protein
MLLHPRADFRHANANANSSQPMAATGSAAAGRGRDPPRGFVVHAFRRRERLFGPASVDRTGDGDDPAGTRLRSRLP